MGCLYYCFTWPLYMIFYMSKFILYIFYYIAKACYYIGIHIIAFIVALFESPVRNIGKSTSNYNRSYNDINSSKNNKLSKQKIYQESDFEKEADLWGLSKEDRRIAKEERMSAADYIEAEERDDDDLDTDEWK